MSSEAEACRYHCTAFGVTTVFRLSVIVLLLQPTTRFSSVCFNPLQWQCVSFLLCLRGKECIIHRPGDGCANDGGIAAVTTVSVAYWWLLLPLVVQGDLTWVDCVSGM